MVTRVALFPDLFNVELHIWPRLTGRVGRVDDLRAIFGVLSDVLVSHPRFGIQNILRHGRRGQADRHQCDDGDG